MSRINDRLRCQAGMLVGKRVLIDRCTGSDVRGRLESVHDNYVVLRVHKNCETRRFRVYFRNIVWIYPR